MHNFVSNLAQELLKTLISITKFQKLHLLVFFGLCLACTNTLQLSDHQKALPSNSKPQQNQFNRVSVSESTSKNQIQDPHRKHKQNRFRQWHSAPTQSVIAPQNGTSKRKQSSDQVKPRSLRLMIAVLLPLSGPYQTWGTLIQKSLRYLQTIYPQFTFTFADTQNDPILAIKNLDDLMNKSPSIDVLIGPLSPKIILSLSQRVQWYELPWFPLGSLPTLSANHFNFSWRLEAQDEAEALAKTLCQSRNKSVATLLIDQPKTRLLVKRLQRLLKSCRITENKIVILPQEKHRQNASTSSQLAISNALIELSGRSQYGPTDPWWSIVHKSHPSVQSRQSPKVHYESLIILARGKQLRQILRALAQWDLEIKPSSVAKQALIMKKYQGQKPPWLNIFTGLGSGSIVSSLAKNDTLEGLICLERAALSAKGKNYLRQRPQANSLELEIVDLLIWLDKARVLSQDTHLSLVKGIRMVSQISGLWGKRHKLSNKLSPPKIKYFKVQNRKLKAIN